MERVLDEISFTASGRNGDCGLEPIHSVSGERDKQVLAALGSACHSLALSGATSDRCR
jgi:hypothetical protein